MPCNSINSTIDILTLALLGVLLLAVLLKKLRTAQSRLLLMVIALHAVNTLADLVTWRLAGEPGQVALALTTMGNMATYLFAALAYTGFCALVYRVCTHDAAPNNVPGKILASGIALLGLVNASLVFINIPTGILYTLDGSNDFAWGPWRGVPDNLAAAQLLLLLPLLLSQKQGQRQTSQHETKRSRVATYLLCAGLPLAAIVLENFYPTLMLLIPAVAIELLLVYVDIQRNQERELIQRDLELADNRLKLLMGQMEPHFVSNSLLAIQQLCAENPRLAQQAIQTFSRYLRGNMEAMHSQSPIPFEHELENIRCYVDLLQTDPNSKVQVEYRLQTTDFAVPALVVQPIVENALIHGAGANPEGGTVSITTREDEHAIYIIVADDGPGFAEAPATEAAPQKAGRASRGKTDAPGKAEGAAAAAPGQGQLPPLRTQHGIGLENVRRRLALQNAGTLSIASGEHGTVATFIIPKGPAR